MAWWERDPERERVEAIRSKRFKGTAGRWWRDAPITGAPAGARWTPPGLDVMETQPQAPAMPSFVQGGPQAPAILPPQAAEVEQQWWEPPAAPAGPSWYESARQMAQEKPVGHQRIAATWEPPDWYTNLTDWTSALMERSVGRFQAVWEKPEVRAEAAGKRGPFNFGEVVGEKERELAATLPPELAALRPPLAAGAALLEGWEALTEKETLDDAAARAEGTYAETWWGQGAGPGRAARLAEQVAGFVLTGLAEPVLGVQDVATAAALASLPQAKGLEPGQIAPLGESGFSILFKPITLEERKAGVVPGSQERLEQVAGPLLERIKAGEKAEDIAREVYNPALQMAALTVFDPLWVLGSGRHAKEMERVVGEATGKYATAVPDMEAVATTLDTALEQARAVDNLTRPAEQAGIIDNLLGKWDDIKQAVNLRELKATSKVSEDLQDAYMMASNAVVDAGSTEEAVARIATWLDNPLMATEELGASVASAKGRRAAELLGQLDLDDFVTLKEGRPFSAQAFGGELLERLKPGLEVEHGVTPLKGYRKGAKVFKNWASEFYLNLNPGYAIKNATNNAGTLGYDGILALDGMPQIEAELLRWGPSTARLAGEEAGAVGAFTAAKSKLPGPLGALAQKGRWVASRSPIGEESFVKRGYAAALRKTWNRVWHGGQGVPPLPPQLVEVIGPEMADDIQRAVAQGVPWEEVVENVRRVMSPQAPGDTLSFVMKYVEAGDLESLSPAAWRYLDGRIRTSKTVDEARAAIEEVREAVRKMGDLAYRREVLEPSRKVFTTTEEVEAVTNLVDDLVADAKKLGIPEPEVEAALTEVQQRLEALRGQLAEAATDAVGDAARVGNRDALEVLYDANREQQKLMEATRLELDALRKETWDLYDAHPTQGQELWDRYFTTATQRWEETFAQRLSLWDDARAGLQRLEAGESVAAILGQDVREVNEARIARQVALEGEAAKDLEAVKGFQARLNILRARVDLAEENARRIGFQIPDQETLDILDDADRLTQDIARKWRVESDALRAQYPGANKAQRAEIKEAQDVLAQKLFGDQAAKWQTAEEALRQRVAPPVAPVAGIEALHQVGFIPGTTADVDAVLAAGVLKSDSGLIFLRPAKAEATFRDAPEYANMVRVSIKGEPRLLTVGSRDELMTTLGVTGHTDDPAVARQVADRLREMGYGGYRRTDFPEMAILSETPHEVTGLAGAGPITPPAAPAEAAAPPVALRSFTPTELRGRVDDLLADVNAEAGDYFKHRTHLHNALKRKLGEDFTWPHPDAADEWAQLRQAAGEYAAGDKIAAAGPLYERAAWERDLRSIYPEEEANAYLAITDARANVWAKQTGRTPAEWYTERLGGMGAGGEAELFQRAPETPDFGRWFEGGNVIDADGGPLQVYHGTTAPEFEAFRVGAEPAGETTLDRMLGPHFAADPQVAERFAWGLYRQPTELGPSGGGRVIPAYLSANVKEIPAARHAHGGMVYDQRLIAWDVAETVYAKRPDLFEEALRSLGRGELTDAQLKAIYQSLAEGRGVPREIAGTLYELAGDWETFPGAGSGFGTYTQNYGGFGGMPIDLKERLVGAYKQILTEQGYTGIKYTNTAPMETTATGFRPSARGFAAPEMQFPEIANRDTYIAFKSEQIKTPWNIRPGDDPRLLFQPEKGGVKFLEDGKAMISMFKGKDVSTMGHELGHVYLNEIIEYATGGDALYGRDLSIVARWTGLDSPDEFRRLLPFFSEYRELQGITKRGGKLTAQQAARFGEIEARAKRYEDAHEMFGKGFIEYLKEGVAPTPELESVFQRFKEWLTELFRGLIGNDPDVELSDSVRGVMDRLLAEAPEPRPGDIDGFLDAGARGVERQALMRTVTDRIPMNLDEAAELMKTGDDWEGLAVKLKRLQDEAATLSDPVSVDAKASAWAHRGEKKYIYVGGYGKTTRRSATARAQREYRSSLIPGEWKGREREFYRRQLDLTQWYEELGNAARARATGQPWEMAQPPEALSKEAFDALATLEQLTPEEQAAVGFGDMGLEEDAIDLYQKGKKPPPEQIPMFPAGEDLPLFTGTAPRAQVPEFAPTEAGRQLGIPGLEPTVEEMTEAQRALRAKGQRPKPPPEGQAALFQRSRQVEDARAVVGATERPGLVDLTGITEPRQLDALDAIEQGLVRDWPQWEQRTADIWQQRVVDAWLRETVQPAWRDARMVATQAADALMKRSLLDYTMQNRLDGYLDLVYPYHYWYTRTGVNWARRAANNPAVLGTYVRYNQMMKEINEQRGLRSRFEGKWRVQMPEGVLPEWTDRNVYFDPKQAMFPFSQWDRTDWDDDVQANDALTSIYQESKKYGQRPYAFMEVPMQYLGLLGERREEIGNLIPATAHIKGVTALAGIGPAGGVNIEAPIRRAAGLQGQEPWDPYRVTRMLASMAGDDPEMYEVALKAEQLQLAVQDGDLDLTDATGESGEMPAALQAIQKEHGWTDEELTEVQAMLKTGLERAGEERGIAALTGMVTGMPSAVLATGEQRQMELQEEARELAWNAEHPGGSREEYRQFKLDHPEIYAREAQYGTFPGDTEEEGLGPAARANWIALRGEKDRINEEYNTGLDNFLRLRPWDLAGAFDRYYDKRQDNLDAADATYPMPEMEGDIPTLLYGMNPDEMWDAVVEEQLYEWQGTEPQADEFAGADGEINWDAYNQAEAEWKAGLPELPTAAGGTYAGMDAETAYKTFEQRHHTPVQGMAYTYRDQVKNPTWDRYRVLVAQGVPKGAAYEQTVTTVGPMPATALIPAILKQYQGNDWTPEQLARELAGITFPAMGEQRKGGEAAGGGGGYAATAYDPTAQPRYLRGTYRRSRGGGGGGGGRWKPRTSQYPRWRPPRFVRGGPFQF